MIGVRLGRQITLDQQRYFRGWQLIRFDRQPVVFVKIVGTFNSANEVFHCVHFECPAQAFDVDEGPSTSQRMLRQPSGLSPDDAGPSTSRAQIIEPEEVEEQQEPDDMQARLDLLDVRGELEEIARDLDQGVNEDL